jgi:hypothetical protein
MSSIRLITPASCVIKIQGFIARMKRLEEDNYTLPRLRTQDLNALIFDLRSISVWASIGTFNKNKQRADEIINEAGLLLRKARKLADEYETFLYNKNHKK